MKKTYQKAVFIFRRDLRLEDNLGLLAALEAAEVVLPIFIFDQRQIDPKQNEYFSAPAFSFLLASLRELHEALTKRGSGLSVFEGDPATVVKSLIGADAVDAVYVNKDYTPFARKRDGAIAEVCTTAGAELFRFDDVALAALEDIRTGQDKIYTVFTPFMKKASEQPVAMPRKNSYKNFYTGDTTLKTVSLDDYTIDALPEQKLVGGRNEGLTLLKANDEYLEGYKDQRNFPAIRGTSYLSAHHKFGTVSIRESYHLAKTQVGTGSQFISELYWRDFYFYISYHFPQVFKKSFLPWAKHLKWINNKQQFAAWQAGKTGVPIVDAGMRELNATGWMHNRIRMVTASYLTKNLLINWQWGEKYFATKLIDYDPSQNNGGWQWSASTGADQRPLRIFNPYTQAEKYDGGAEYIKRWIPELREVPVKVLTDGKTQDLSQLAPDYPAPLVDQRESYHRTMATYKAAKEKYRMENGYYEQDR